MKSINVLNKVLILVMLTSLFSCTTDDSGNIENTSNSVFDWEVKIVQSGNYNEFVSSLSIDGDGDHSWLMNDDDMNLVEFVLPEEMIIKNNQYKYPNLKLEYHSLPILQDTMYLNIQIFKDGIEKDNINYTISEEKDIYLNY